MKIELLYPEIANLYGDTYNIEYLQKSCPAIQAAATALTKAPRFLKEPIDLVYLGTMTEHSQVVAIEALKPYRKELAQAIEEGQRFLVTGNALELFGSRITDVEGETVEGLGLFAFHTTRDMLHRYNSLYLGSYGDITVVGYKSQFTQSYYDQPLDPLFTTRRGPGFHPGIAGEGLSYRNFRATYVLGPLLVLNPPLTRKWLAEWGLPDTGLAQQEAAMEAYQARVKEYSDPHTGFSY